MTFAVGDRVKLNPETADGWCQPLRKFAETGRQGTVTVVSSGVKGRSPVVGAVVVLFDKGRANARDVREAIREKELILL